MNIRTMNHGQSRAGFFTLFLAVIAILALVFAPTLSASASTVGDGEPETTATPSATESPTPTPTPTGTPTPTVSPGPTETPLPSDSPTPTPLTEATEEETSETPPGEEIPAPEPLPSPFDQLIPSPSPLPENSAPGETAPAEELETLEEQDSAPGETPEALPEASPEASPAVTTPVGTPSPVNSETPNPTESASPTPTESSTPTVTESPKPSETPEPTGTPSPTESASPTATGTPTPTPTETLAPLETLKKVALDLTGGDGVLQRALADGSYCNSVGAANQFISGSGPQFAIQPSMFGMVPGETRAHVPPTDISEYFGSLAGSGAFVVELWNATAHPNTGFTPGDFMRDVFITGTNTYHNGLPTRVLISGTSDMFLTPQHDSQWFPRLGGGTDVKTFRTLDGTELVGTAPQLNTWGIPGPYAGGNNIRPGWAYNSNVSAGGYTYTLTGPPALQGGQPGNNPAAGYDQFHNVYIPELVDPASIVTALTQGFGSITRDFEFNSTQNRTTLYPPVYLFLYSADCWSLEKSSVAPSGSTVNPGDTITYTLTADNFTSSTQGTGVNNIRITDDLSNVLPHIVGGIRNITPSIGTVTVVGNELFWDIPTLAMGSTHTLTYQVTVGNYSNITISNGVTGVDSEILPTTCFEPGDLSSHCATNHNTPDNPNILVPLIPELVPSVMCGVEGTIAFPTQAGITYGSTRVGNTVTWTATANAGYSIQTAAVVTGTIEIPAIVPCPVAQLPELGGFGILPYQLGGVGFILAALLLFGIWRRKNASASA